MYQTPGLAAQRHAQLKHTLKHELLKMEWDLVRLQAELLQIQFARIKHALLQSAKHNPNWHSQPRVPAGNADGGQWTDGGGGGGPARDNTPKPTRKPEPNRTIHDPPIEPVYPVEAILGGLTVRGAISAIREVLSRRAISRAAKAIEDYLGGRPEVYRNKKGDVTVEGNGKQIRLNIEAPHGYDPHFHIEKQLPNGELQDASPQHMFFFKKGK